MTDRNDETEDTCTCERGHTRPGTCDWCIGLGRAELEGRVRPIPPTPPDREEP